MQAADTHARAQTLNEYPHLGSRRLEESARLLPGRMRTMMHLASLSGNSRVSNVAETWNSFTAVARVETHIGELCRSAGISDADFIREVNVTAVELGIPRCIKLNGEPGYGLPLRAALGEALMASYSRCPLRYWPPTEWNRCLDRLLAAWNRRASHEAAALRRSSRLSQAQFASLFMTTVRTVKRWECGQSALTVHQQFFLRLFVQYIERNGVCEFRRRFVREAARYAKRGRPRGM